MNPNPNNVIKYYSLELNASEYHQYINCVPGHLAHDKRMATLVQQAIVEFQAHLDSENKEQTNSIINALEGLLKKLLDDNPPPSAITVHSDIDRLMVEFRKKSQRHPLREMFYMPLELKILSNLKANIEHYHLSLHGARNLWLKLTDAEKNLLARDPPQPHIDFLQPITVLIPLQDCANNRYLKREGSNLSLTKLPVYLQALLSFIEFAVVIVFRIPILFISFFVSFIMQCCFGLEGSWLERYVHNFHYEHAPTHTRQLQINEEEYSIISGYWLFFEDYQLFGYRFAALFKDVLAQFLVTIKNYLTEVLHLFITADENDTIFEAVLARIDDAPPENLPPSKPFERWVKDSHSSSIDPIDNIVVSLTDLVIDPMFRTSPFFATLFFLTSVTSFSVFSIPQLRLALGDYAEIFMAIPSFLSKHFTGKAVTSDSHIVFQLFASFLQWKVLFFSFEGVIEVAHRGWPKLAYLLENSENFMLGSALLVASGYILGLIPHIRSLNPVSVFINAFTDEARHCAHGTMPFNFLEYAFLALKFSLITYSLTQGTRSTHLLENASSTGSGNNVINNHDEIIKGLINSVGRGIPLPFASRGLIAGLWQFSESCVLYNVLVRELKQAKYADSSDVIDQFLASFYKRYCYRGSSNLARLIITYCPPLLLIVWIWRGIKYGVACTERFNAPCQRYQVKMSFAKDAVLWIQLLAIIARVIRTLMRAVTYAFIRLPFVLVMSLCGLALLHPDYCKWLFLQASYISPHRWSFYPERFRNYYHALCETASPDSASLEGDARNLTFSLAQ